MSTALQSSDLTLDLREHEICWTVPPGAAIASTTVELPGGAIVQGKLRGKVVCKTGSFVLAAGGEFSGSVEAERIYIAGRIYPGPNGEPTMLKGKRLVSVSEAAEGAADLVSMAFSIHTTKFSARITTMPRS